MTKDMMDGVETVISQANEFVLGLQGYSYLWLDERKAYLDSFLTYSRQLTNEEHDLLAAMDPLAPAPSPPKMDHFREQVRVPQAPAGNSLPILLDLSKTAVGRVVR